MQFIGSCEFYRLVLGVMPRRFARTANQSAGRDDGHQSGSRLLRKGPAKNSDAVEPCCSPTSSGLLQSLAPEGSSVWDETIGAVAAELISNGLHEIEGGTSNTMVEEGLRVEHLERTIYR